MKVNINSGIFIIFLNFLFITSFHKVVDNKFERSERANLSHITEITDISSINIKNNDDLIDISSGYTHVNPQDKTYFYIAIISTSDIHGNFYPEELEIGDTNYNKGGLDYVAKYINILKNEFPNRVLYLDAGDQFKGSTESFITNGEIMIDYFNSLKTDGATFGEHEFDFSREYLENKIDEANFPYISTNIYDLVKQTKNAFGENHITSKVFIFNVTNFNYNNTSVDKIKIGIVGLSKRIQTNEIKGKGYEDILFLDYKEELTNEAKKLREEDGVHAVILLSHLGIKCGTEKTLKLNLYTRLSEQEYCSSSNSELYSLISSLDSGVIDAVITGESHYEVHHWVNDIPIMSPIDSGLYANIMYLPFKWNTMSQKYFLFNNKIQIEGPLPICEKVFESIGSCPFIKESLIQKYLPLTEYKFHGIKIEKDESLEIVHEKYDKEYEIYREKIATIIGTENILEVYNNGDFYIGNIIADIQNHVCGSDISIVGISTLSSSWNPGRLTKANILEMLPYQGSLCTFTMNGDEIKHMIYILQTGEKAYYPTSGLKQIIDKDNKGNKYLSYIKLFDGYKEYELRPEVEYIVSTIDYFINSGGDDFNKVLEWYNPRNLKCNYGTPAEIVEKYLKIQKVIDVRKYKDEFNPRIKELF